MQELILSKPPNNFCLKVILRDTYNLITNHFVRIKVITNKNLGFKTSLKMIRFDAKSHENTIYLLSEGKETEKTLRSQKVVINTIFLYLIYIETPQNSWICEEFRYI